MSKSESVTLKPVFFKSYKGRHGLGATLESLVELLQVTLVRRYELCPLFITAI